MIAYVLPDVAASDFANNVGRNAVELGKEPFGAPIYTDSGDLVLAQLRASDSGTSCAPATDHSVGDVLLPSGFFQMVWVYAAAVVTEVSGIVMWPDRAAQLQFEREAVGKSARAFEPELSIAIADNSSFPNSAARTIRGWLGVEFEFLLQRHAACSRSIHATHIGIARRQINGTDHADDIAAIHAGFLAGLS